MFKNHIAGDWVEGQDAARNINPSDTDDVIGEFVRGGHRCASGRRRCGNCRWLGNCGGLGNGRGRH